jgi:hypothetical protein
MSYGPCDFQDDVLTAARGDRIKGLPRSNREWGRDDHEQAAWVICRALDERKQALADRKALVKALRDCIIAINEELHAAAGDEHPVLRRHARISTRALILLNNTEART